MRVFLTGGSSGIGQAINKDLQKDHDVVALPRSELDLSKPFLALLSDFDALVLCAGADRSGNRPFVDMPDDDWQYNIQVNLIANMHLVKFYLDQRPPNWGKIIVIGSTSTDYAWPGKIPYSVSKTGLETFCQGIQRELPPEIGLTYIQPGLCKTNLRYNRHKGTVPHSEIDAWYAGQNYMVPEDLVAPVRTALDDRQHLLKHIRLEK